MSCAKSLLSIACTSLLLSAPALAAGDPDREGRREAAGWNMVLDLVIARPLSLVATVAGTAVFVVALPFEALSGDIDGPAHVLVGEPAAYTFTRPLGEFH